MIKQTRRECGMILIQDRACILHMLNGIVFGKLPFDGGVVATLAHDSCLKRARTMTAGGARISSSEDCHAL